ncbi:MAG: hypothetical protein LUO79_03595 [Methanomassiliicoccales archaeon]|nr:hypothetical protein [Methanomassiliicoccales archaeon]
MPSMIYEKLEGAWQVNSMPWEETEDYIRSGHGNLDDYEKGSMRTIAIDEAKGIKAVVACPKGNYKGGKCATGTQVVSFLFARDKGWTMAKAKDWFVKNEGHKKSAKR